MTKIDDIEGGIPRPAMLFEAGPYRFRPFVAADLPMMARWLRTPEVVAWWGDPEHELHLVTEDLDAPLMRQWLVEHAGRPFAYVQSYPVHAWPQAHLAHLPPGSVAVDLFVGEPDMLGLGHCGLFLRSFANHLIGEGAPVVAIDPSADNERAIRAYARAGFVGDAVVDAGEGPVVVMVFRAPALKSTL